MFGLHHIWLVVIFSVNDRAVHVFVDISERCRAVKVRLFLQCFFLNLNLLFQLIVGPIQILQLALQLFDF